MWSEFPSAVFRDTHQCHQERFETNEVQKALGPEGLSCTLKTDLALYKHSSGVCAAKDLAGILRAVPPLFAELQRMYLSLSEKSGRSNMRMIKFAALEDDQLVLSTICSYLRIRSIIFSSHLSRHVPEPGMPLSQIIGILGPSCNQDTIFSLRNNHSHVPGWR